MKKFLVSVVAMWMTGGAAYAGTAASQLGLDQISAEGFGISVPAVSKGRVEPVKYATPIEWVSIRGGKFMMGTTDFYMIAGPPHEVAIKTFQMSKTDVTVAQYKECVDKDVCRRPDNGHWCNWDEPGRENHPVNCVSWDQAVAYAKFKKARLPSESEWEYAATSGGKSQDYPWGNDKPTCDRAVMYDESGPGCGTKATMPVCSKPAGNTAQGLCDMTGNAWQWVQDKYRAYAGAPVDGSAFEPVGGSDYRVIRGGSFYSKTAFTLQANTRRGIYSRAFDIGFRIAR